MADRPAAHNPLHMDATITAALRKLVDDTVHASLSTLHKGAPALSMTPFAVMPDGSGLVIHVSRLATHTNDMLEHPQVAMMVMGQPGSSESPLALPRLSLQGLAHPCSPDDSAYGAAKAAYLRRLPDSEELFSFGDFSLFTVTVQSARLVAGFGRAHAISAAQFAQAFAASDNDQPLGV